MENNLVNELTRSGVFYRFNAIIKCIKKGTLEKDEILALYELKGDNAYIAGYRISDYAKAALNNLDIEKYDGREENVLRLITADILKKA